MSRAAACLSRSSRAFPDLHVLDLHDRLFSRRHARSQLALRRGCALHQRLAVVHAAGVLLRSVPPVAAGKDSCLLGQIQRAVHQSLEALRLDREREEGVELLLHQYGRRHSRHAESRATGRGLRVVSGRQPGPRRRRCADLGRAQQGRVCNAVLDGKMATNVTGACTTGTDSLARSDQVSRRSRHLDQPDAGQRHGSLLSRRGRRERSWRRSALGEDRPRLFPVDGAARRAFREQDAPSPTSAW